MIVFKFTFPAVIIYKIHDDVIKRKHFRVTGPLCGEVTRDRWIPRTKASDAELGCFLLSAPWINGWVSNGDAGDLRRHHAHYYVIVMSSRNEWRMQRRRTWNIILPHPPLFQHFSLIFGNANDKVTQCFSLENKCKKNKKLWKEKKRPCIINTLKSTVT